MGDTLNSNQVRAIQHIVKGAKTDDPDEKIIAIGRAQWFLKQEYDRLLKEEIDNASQKIHGLI